MPWSTRKQKVLAQSSTKVEYRALATEILLLKSLLLELHVSLTHPLVLFCDNVNAKHLVTNPIQHA